MALIALHSKRERKDSAGDSASLKRARASRPAERVSGRPSSLTSITPTLSPIAERPRMATASPPARNPHQAQSTQSLFEEETERDEEEVPAARKYVALN